MSLAKTEDKAWRRLREVCWSPPGRAATGVRASTFITCLHQFEQLLRSGAHVDSSTRVVHLFCGLSQAGRAIAAAAEGFCDDTWKLTSHGIRATGFGDDFADIVISTSPPGTSASFVRLSELLDSPLWESVPLRLEDIWDTLPVPLAPPQTSSWRLPAFAPRVFGHVPYREEPVPATPLSLELHPLMAWWAVLYALCKLAQVEPARWAVHTSHVSALHAHAVEELLQRALTHLPVLIADTIDEVAFV
ncbi:hypothetical protein [Streptomyces sp. NPDC029004]|uniref:YaaC family protein n=1 Tax=Streptomyces sp. NPDC029004 TaxID=3154490 RepID=UPI00340E86D0